MKTLLNRLQLRVSLAVLCVTAWGCQPTEKSDSEKQDLDSNTPAAAPKPESDDENVHRKAEQGDALAQWELGWKHYFGWEAPNDYSEAIKWLLKAAAHDRTKAGWSVADAGYLLGESYRYGRGVRQNPAQAIYWYRKAAEEGHVRAQFQLGWAYLHGQEVPKDYAEAVNWWRKAVKVMRMRSTTSP